MIISIDGNNIGRRIEQYIFNESLNDLSKFSQGIQDYISLLCRIIKENSGIIYMSGGDNILARINPNDLDCIISAISKTVPPFHTTFAIGCGETSQLAYIALAHRKSNPNNGFIVSYCKLCNGKLEFSNIELPTNDT